MDPPSCSTDLNFDSVYFDQPESTLGQETDDILRDILSNLSNDNKNTANEGNRIENGSKESFIDLNFRPGSDSSELEDETGCPGPLADQVASLIERLKLQNKELRERNVEQERDLASYEERLSEKINESFQLKQERDHLKEELESINIERSSLQTKLGGKESELKQFKELIQTKCREENEIQHLHKQIANKSKMLEKAEKTFTRSNLLVKKHEKNLRILRFKNRKIMETLLEFAEVLKSKELFSPKKRKHLLNIQEKYGADSDELIEGFECEDSVSKINSSNLNEENEPCSSEILDTSLVSSPVKIKDSTFPDPDLKSHPRIEFNKDILMTESRKNENSHAYQSNVSSMCKNEKTSSSEHLQNRQISSDEAIISSTYSNFQRTDSMCSDDLDITDECFAEIEERINLEMNKTANFLLKPVSPIPSPKTINHRQRHQSNIKIKKRENMNDLINTPTKECDIDLEKTSSLSAHVEKTRILSHQISEGFEPHTAEPTQNNNNQTAMDIETSLELSSISQTLIPPNLHYICSTYSNEDDNFRILHQGNSVYDYLVNPENKLSVCVLSVPKGNSFVSRKSSTLNSRSLNSTILPTKEERMKSVLSMYYASEKRVSSIKSQVSKTLSPQENENLSHICVVIDGKSELVNSLHKSENSSSSRDNDNSYLTIEKCFEAVQDDRNTTETEKQQKFSYDVSPTKRKTLTASLKYVESVEEKLVGELGHEPSKSIICKTTTNKNSSFDTHQPTTALTNGKKSSPKHFLENPSILLNKTDKNLDTIPDVTRLNSNNNSSAASVQDTLTKNCTFTPIIDYLTSPKKQRLSKTFESVETSCTTNDSVNDTSSKKNSGTDSFKNCCNSTSDSYYNETKSIKEVFSPIKSCNNLNDNLSSAEPSFSSEYAPCDTSNKLKKCDPRAIKRQQNVALFDTNCTTDTAIVDKENEPNFKSGLVDIFGKSITEQASDIEEPFSKRQKVMKSPEKIVNRKLIFPDTSSINAVKSPKKQIEGKFISVSDMNHFNAQKLSDEQNISTLISASDTYSMKTEKQIKREMISAPNKNSIDIVKTPEKQIKTELISPPSKNSIGVKTPEKQIQMKLISTPNKNSIDFAKTLENQIQMKLISTPNKNSIDFAKTPEKQIKKELIFSPNKNSTCVNTSEKQIKMELISTPNKNYVNAVKSPEKQVEAKSISESDEVITNYLMRIISKHSPKKLIHQSSSEMQVDSCIQEDKPVENISVNANFISSDNESDSKITIDDNKSSCIFKSPEKCMENKGMLSHNCDQVDEKVNNLIEQGNKKVNKIKKKTKLIKKRVKNLTKQKSVKLNKNANKLSNKKEKIFSNILNSKKKKECTKQNLFNSTSENSSVKILPDLKDTKDFNNCVPETTLTTTETKFTTVMDPQQLQIMDIQQQPQRTGFFKPINCHISGESIKGTVILPSCTEDVINYPSDIAASVITEILNNVDSYDLKSSLSKKEAVGEKDNGFLHSISPNSFSIHTEVHSSEADENKYFDTDSKVWQKKLINGDSRLNNSKNKSVLNDSPSLSLKKEFNSISSLNPNISTTSKGTESKVVTGFKDEDTIIYSPPMQAERLELDVPINSANGDSNSVGNQANSAFSNIVNKSNKIMSPKPQRIIDNEIIKGNLSALSVMNQKDLVLSSNVETLSQNISITSNELEKNERVKDIASLESANNCTESKVPVINNEGFVAAQVQTIKKYNTRRSSILSSISESENSLVIAEDIENENELVIAEEIENESPLVIAEEIENESPLVIAEDVENENPLIASAVAEEQFKYDPESSEEMDETVETFNKKVLKTARRKMRKKTKSAANKRKKNKSSNEAASPSKRKKPISSNETESVNNAMSISSVLMNLDRIKYSDLLSNESHFKMHLHTLVNVLINPSNASDTASVLYQVFNYVSSSKKNPLMSFVIQQDNSVFFPLSEKCIVAALHQVELKKKNHLTGLVSTAISTLYFLVLEKKSISKAGLGAFCRIFACLCKCGENKKKTLMLCCDLIKTKHPSAPYLIASIIGVWNELFSITDSTSELEKLLLSSIAYGVGKKPQTLNSTDWKQCKTLFSKYLDVSPISDVIETSKILIDFLKNHLNAKSTETDYMVIEPLVIFSSFEGWNWAEETIINNFLLPSMAKYALEVKNERAFSLLCELYAEISLSISDYQEPCVTLWKFYMSEKALGVKAHDYVKDCAARNLIKLVLLKKLDIPGDLYQWVQENQDNLVGTQIEFLLKRRLVGDDTTFTERDISSVN